MNECTSANNPHPKYNLPIHLYLRAHPFAAIDCEDSIRPADLRRLAKWDFVSLIEVADNVSRMLRIADDDDEDDEEFYGGSHAHAHHAGSTVSYLLLLVYL